MAALDRLEAALSHETALDVYGISDVNPNRIHLTVGKQRRFRRAGGEDYALHYENLTPKQIGWWQEIPTVTPATALEQCIAFGTPTYLLRHYLLTPGSTARSEPAQLIE